MGDGSGKEDGVGDGEIGRVEHGNGEEDGVGDGSGMEDGVHGRWRGRTSGRWKLRERGRMSETSKWRGRRFNI